MKNIKKNKHSITNNSIDNSHYNKLHKRLNSEYLIPNATIIAKNVILCHIFVIYNLFLNNKGSK